MSKLGTDLKELHANERIKDASEYLRGTLAEGLSDELTGAICSDDTQLSKFHGIYMQDDRDIRPERRKKKLEPAYSFMARIRVPGGLCTPQQWLEMDRLCDTYANGVLKLTTRQAFQFHGIIKNNLKTTIAEINKACMDTIAACGDVNRNVMCNPNPHLSPLHAQAQELAQALSDHLTPRTRAYHEIWLDEERVAGGPEEEEPIYGKHYLPRKFKTVVAIPPSNDVDIFAHDLGYIAIAEGDKIIGYNVTVGGGMGMTHGREDTFPRTADILGFVTPEQAVDVGEKVLLVQRDHGNRKERANARLKYTIQKHGIEWFRQEVEKRLGHKLGEARPYTFTSRGDRFGWSQGTDGHWHLGLRIENGKLADEGDRRLKTGLREIAKVHQGDFRLSANQNVVIGSVPESEKATIDQLVTEYGLDLYKEASGLRLNAMACVALPTCGLALAESQRYLPDLVGELETILDEVGLRKEEIVIRMTGCPNGCARPYLAEIGFVGKGPRTYNLYLGAAFTGERLSKLYKADVKDHEIADVLRPILEDYAANRKDGERFGDFVIRKQYVEPTTAGIDFHI